MPGYKLTALAADECDCDLGECLFWGVCAGAGSGGECAIGSGVLEAGRERHRWGAEPGMETSWHGRLIVEASG